MSHQSDEGQPQTDVTEQTNPDRSGAASSVGVRLTPETAPAESQQSRKQPTSRQDALFNPALSFKHRNSRENRTICRVWTIVMCVGWWIPVVFGFAAANVLDTCELDLATFLGVISVLSLVVYPTFHTLTVVAARTTSRVCREATWILIVVLGFAVVALLIGGFTMRTQTTDSLCYDASAGRNFVAINPRTLLMVWLLTSVFVVGTILLLVVGSVLGLMGLVAAKMPDEEHDRPRVVQA